MNTPKEHFSDEILNAYVDDELAPEDSARISEAIKIDEILRRRVADIQKISELVRAAFSEIDPPVRQPQSQARRYPAIYLWPAAAAIAFFSLAGLLGWHMYEHHPHMANSTVAALLATDNKLKQTPANQIDITQDAVKVMFHIGRDDAKLFDNVLNETDRLLSNYRDSDLVIRVIASHGGLSLFKINLTENAKRVRKIKSKHGTRVEFVGCGETYNQWQIKKTEKDTTLLPEMLMVDSGVFELLRRQRQGWKLLSI